MRAENTGLPENYQKHYQLTNRARTYFGRRFLINAALLAIIGTLPDELRPWSR